MTDPLPMTHEERKLYAKLRTNKKRTEEVRARRKKLGMKEYPTQEYNPDLIPLPHKENNDTDKS